VTTLTETTRVFDWLRATINPLASNRVYRDIAPDQPTTPYVIVGLMSGRDVAGAAGIRLWQDGLYLVKVVGKRSDWTAMVALADAIDSALQLATGNTADATIIRAVREESIAYSEVVGADVWSHLGAIWRVYTKKTS
jgi:hypothetical protein